MSDELIIQQLVEHLTQREVALFLGPDLPEALSGVPSWAELADRLATHARIPPGGDWPTVATRYEQVFGRRNLIDWLDSQVNARQPGPIYPALAALPVSKFIAATYDDALQSTLESVGRKPNIVIEETDLNFIKADQPTVVKLFGEASPGRRDALLLTASDIRGLAQYRSKILRNQVQPAFNDLTLLILGQDVKAEFFRELYYRDLPQADALRRQAYAVWSGLETWQKEEWAANRLTIIDADPLALVTHLAGAVSRQPLTTATPARRAESPIVSAPVRPSQVPQPATGTSAPPGPPEAAQTTTIAQGDTRPSIEQLPRMIRAFTVALIVIAVVFTAMGLLIRDAGILALTVVAAVLGVVLVSAAALVAVHVLSPEAGERLFNSVLQALPLLGRLAGRTPDVAPKKEFRDMRDK